MRTSQRIINSGTFSTSYNQTSPPQHRQLLRQISRLNPHLRQHFRHSMLTFTQQLQHPNPSRMPQSLKKLSFRLIERSTPPPHISYHLIKHLPSLASSKVFCTRMRSHRDPPSCETNSNRHARQKKPST